MIYAVEYLRGIADELGSSAALDHLLTQGAPPDDTRTVGQSAGDRDGD
jgi:hypothetical protein